MSASVEHITADGMTICYLVRAGAFTESTFVTRDEDPLQVGHIVHPRGHEIRRHQHRQTERRIVHSSEVLVVQSGRCDIDIYDEGRQLIATRTLESGDVVVILAGGHGFRMLDDTVLLEIKQGPFRGDSEKELF